MKIYRYLVISLLFAAPLAAGCSHTGEQARKGQEISAQQISYDRPGFVTEVKDGRLWVFRKGAKELEDFHKHGELVKQVIRPGAGPNGITIKAPDTETINDYLKAK